jgi:hypothetical protein
MACLCNNHMSYWLKRSREGSGNNKQQCGIRLCRLEPRVGCNHLVAIFFEFSPGNTDTLFCIENKGLDFCHVHRCGGLAPLLVLNFQRCPKAFVVQFVFTPSSFVVLTKRNADAIESPCLVALKYSLLV